MNNEFNNNSTGSFDNNQTIPNNLNDMTNQNNVISQQNTGYDNSGLNNNVMPNANQFVDSNQQAATFQNNLNYDGMANQNFNSEMNNQNNFYDMNQQQNVNTVTPNYNNFNQPIEQQNPNFNNNIQPDAKKSPIVPIIIAIVVIALVVVGGIFGYKYFIMSKPTKIIDKSIDTLASKTELLIKEFNEKINEVNNRNMLNELYVELNGSSLELITKLDMKNKVIGASVDANMESSNLLNASAILDEKGVYFKVSDESTNNYALYEDFSEFFETTENTEELNPVLANFVKHFKNSFAETITEEMFVKSEDNIILDGKTKKVKKYAIVLNEKTVNPLLENYKNKLTNDDALVSYLTDLYNDNQSSEYLDIKYDKLDIKELIEDIIDNMKINSANSDPVNFALYIKGSNLLKISLYDEDNSIDIYVNDGIKFTFNVENEEYLNFEYKEDFIKFNIKEEYGENLDFEYKKDYIKLHIYDQHSDIVDFKLNNKNYELTLGEDFNNVFVSGELREVENGAEVTFKTKIEGQEYKGLLRLKTSYPEKLDLEIPKNVLDISNDTYMELLETEVQNTPLYSILSLMMGNLGGNMYEDEIEIDYDNYNDDFDFEF